MTEATETKTPAWRRLVRDPLTVFLGLGGGIFALYAVFGAGGQEPVRYTPEIEAALVDEFELLSGREADQEDLARIKRDFLTDELLFREAVDRGIHLTDGKVRAQMIDKVRYLVAGAPGDPGEEEVLDYYAENIDLYESEPEISFEQVFFEELPADEDSVLSALRSGQQVNGDDLWTGPAYPDYGHSMIRGIFGQDFLETLEKAPVGEWTGPMRSQRGWHFVLKTQTNDSRLRPYGEVRDQVRQDLIIANMQREIDRAFEELRDKFEVQIDA